MKSSNSQFDRQERMFGEDGQKIIKNTHALICGLGGIGSHVSQQLVYLGIENFSLIDSDHVEFSNLNRLIGSTKKHIGLPKVEVAEQMIKNINPTANVICIKDKIELLDQYAKDTVPNVIIGSVNNDAARLLLTDYASRKHIPYMDIASEIHPSEGIVGGHTYLSYGTGCLLCSGQIDQDEVRRYNASESELEFDKLVYGVNSKLLKDSGPSVVSLNGIMASIGCFEIMLLLTQMSKPIPSIIFQRRENFGCWTISNSQTSNNENCYYCNRYIEAA